MSEEKKTISEDKKEETAKDLSEKELKSKTADLKTEKPELKVEEEKSFSLDAGLEEDLPEDIKQKLEKNKLARAKKKHIKKKKKVAHKAVKSGRAYVNASYNNTIVTLTDPSGNVLSWASAGVAGFRGAKKATPYAAQIISKIAIMKAKEEYGLKEVKVFVSGVGTGRESAIRALNANGIEVLSIKDTTPVPHNGCRPKKPRRV